MSNSGCRPIFLWFGLTPLEQAIGNVVANAVAHTPAGTYVVLEAEVAPDAVALRVCDDRLAIAGNLPVILTNSSKGAGPADPRADGGHGTGLGLVIAKGICGRPLRHDLPA
jgi:two-component system, OmpR family, sensor histidine kinase KdpD